MGSVLDATERAIKASKLTSMDVGAVAALRVLALKIDTEAELREIALAYAEENHLKPPSADNVSIPTYLKFCESLGMTPAGRVRLNAKKETAGGNLAKLRSVKTGRTA